MTARRAITTTFFGDVDTAALESLESSYDTTRLLAAVDIVDRIRTQLHDLEGLRDDLLEIQSMVHRWCRRDARAPCPSGCWTRSI